MAARPEGLLESLGKTRAGPWLRRPPQAEGPPHIVQDAGLREHPSAGAPILEEQSRGASGQGSERRSLGRRAHTRPLAKRCALEGPSNTPNTNVPPEVTLLPNKPVELGEPNTLICFIDKFSPPVISVTWLRNGKPVTDGVSQTVFLPRNDHLFRKFHYLPFLPTTEDVYDCKVEHLGLNEPLLKHWEYEAPAPLPETTENAVCALGLIVALVGIIAGTIFIIKGVRKANTVERRGPL